MRLIIKIILAAYFPLSIICAQSGTPGDRVTEFLNKYHSMKFSGLPDEHQAKDLSSQFSPALNKLIQKAIKVQHKFRTKSPDEKPPLVEGDLFSSLFEGPTSFEIMETETDHDKAVVTIKFKYSDPAQKNNSEIWNDSYRLVKSKSGWFIYDVEYLGKWDFALKGTLRGLLKEAIKDGE